MQLGLLGENQRLNASTDRLSDARIFYFNLCSRFLLSKNVPMTADGKSTSQKKHKSNIIVRNTSSLPLFSARVRLIASYISIRVWKGGLHRERNRLFQYKIFLTKMDNQGKNNNILLFSTKERLCLLSH